MPHNSYTPMTRVEALAALEALGWKKRELAEKAGVDRPRISHALTLHVPICVAEALRAGLAEQEQTAA